MKEINTLPQFSEDEINKIINIYSSGYSDGSCERSPVLKAFASSPRTSKEMLLALARRFMFPIELAQNSACDAEVHEVLFDNIPKKYWEWQQDSGFHLALAKYTKSPVVLKKVLDDADSIMQDYPWILFSISQNENLTPEISKALEMKLKLNNSKFEHLELSTRIMLHFSNLDFSTLENGQMAIIIAALFGNDYYTVKHAIESGNLPENMFNIARAHLKEVEEKENAIQEQRNKEAAYQSFVEGFYS